MKIQLAGIDRQQLDELTDQYTDQEIGKILGLTRTAATYHRRRLGVMSWSQKHGERRYQESYEVKPGQKRAFSHRIGCNESCFERIDSPEAAYWLGLISADGWIVTERGKVTGVALALKSADIETLKAYAAFVGYKCPPIKTRPEADLLQVKITSRKMAQDLISHGVVPRKSKVLELPTLQNHLMPHYLRGLLDGDGCYAVRTNPSGSKTLSAQLTSASINLLSAIKAITDRVTARPATIAKDRSAYILRWYADNAVSLRAYLYRGDPSIKPSMSRKAEIFFSYES